MMTIIYLINHSTSKLFNKVWITYFMPKIRYLFELVNSYQNRELYTYGFFLDMLTDFIKDHTQIDGFFQAQIR